MIEALPMRQLRRDGGTQLRQRMNAEATTEYAEALARGEEFPPVVVFFDGEDHWLSDGFHRYDAHTLAGREEILCEVREGSRKDAVLYSATANRAHGVRLTPEDREKIVMALVQEFPEAIQAQIATMANLDPSTVSRICQRRNIAMHNSPRGRPPKGLTPIESALVELPEEQSHAIEALLTAPLVPPDRALEAAQNVAAMNNGQRQRVAELAASEDYGDREAAVAMLRGIVYVDPAWPLVNVCLEDLQKGLRMHKGDEVEGAFRVCIQHVEGLKEALEAVERRKTGATA